MGSAFASGIGWVFIWVLSFHELKQYLFYFRWSIFIKNLLGVGIFSLCTMFIHMSDFLTGRIQMLWGILGVIFLYGIVFIILNLSEFYRMKKLFFS